MWAGWDSRWAADVELTLLIGQGFFFFSYGPVDTLGGSQMWFILEVFLQRDLPFKTKAAQETMTGDVWKSWWGLIQSASECIACNRIPLQTEGHWQCLWRTCECSHWKRDSIWICHHRGHMKNLNRSPDCIANPKPSSFFSLPTQSWKIHKCSMK